MSEMGERILGILADVISQMSNSEKEKFLLYSEGMAAVVRMQGAAQDSA